MEADLMAALPPDDGPFMLPKEIHERMNGLWSPVSVRTMLLTFHAEGIVEREGRKHTHGIVYAYRSVKP